MLVSLILGRQRTTIGLRPGDMGTGPTDVAVEGPHPGFQGIGASLTEHGEVRIPLGLKLSKARVQELFLEVKRCPRGTIFLNKNRTGDRAVTARLQDP